MNKLIITLKQHTPLLHFQPMQEGATLRASEVKPKLDKFLLTKLGNGDYDEGVQTANNKGWLIGDSNALNYKMRIEAEVTKHYTIPISPNKKGNFETQAYPFILSNMGGKENEDDIANLSFSKNCRIIMIIPENKSRNLYDFILDKNNNSTILATFFANNNFGQRSTKGFGSFSVESISDDKGINIHFGKISDFLPIGTPILRFTIHNSDKSEQVKTMFEVIDYYWKCLKSGVNYTKRKVRSDEKVDIVHKERYIKSFLYIYLQSTNYTWEKRCVKQTFNLETKCPERYIEKNTREPMFARALLGLQEHMEYRVPQGKLICRDNNKEFIKRNDVAITSINKSIDRIASPIIFKPCIVDDEIRVYILFDTELIEKLQQLSVEQCSFDFECKGKHLQLSLKPNVVDYKDLIKKFHAYINNNKQVFSNGLESWSFIPRNFKWDNILGKNGNRDNLVYLRQKS